MKLSKFIEETYINTNQIGLFYLEQAGFYFKTAEGITVAIDPYLSDAGERLVGFKRMIPSLISPSKFNVDILAATHNHLDHLDPDLLVEMSKRADSFFIGATDCRETFENAGIQEDRFTLLNESESIKIRDIEFRAIYADHGELAPQAVGFLMNFDGINVYNTGDTAVCTEKIQASLGDVKIDIMLVPINPAYGNPGEEGACRLAEKLNPKVVIASHFGMFIEHGGNPGEFLELAKKLLPSSTVPIVMAPGERMIYSSTEGIISMDTLKVS